MTQKVESAVMTVEETAAYLRIGRSHAYEMVRTSQIPSIKLGRKILIPRRALEQMLTEASQSDPEARDGA